MKWACILANFFLPGLGYLIGVPEKRAHAPFWLAGVVGLTYVEQFSGLEATLPQAFNVMFAAVLIMNTGFAIDTFKCFKDKGA